MMDAEDVERRMRVTLAANVRELRQQRGMTQRGLSRAAEISAQQVSRIERSYCSTTVDVVSRLADALDVPASRLLDENPRLQD